MNKLDFDNFLTDVSVTKSLGKSKRQEALLKYLVEHSINGTTNLITEYSIAIDVIGRSEEFDPATDGIVRSEMTRLREKLNTYSLQSDKFKAEIPRASYKLELTKKSKFPKLSDTISIKKPVFYGLLACIPILATLNVYAFINPSTGISVSCSNSKPNIGSVVEGKDVQYSEFLQKTVDATLVQHTHFNFTTSPNKCQKSDTPGFSISLEVKQIDSKDFVEISLLDLSKGEILVQMTQSIGYENGSPALSEKAIVRLVNEWASPYGMVMRRSVSNNWSDPSQQKRYGCILRMYDSFLAETDQDYTDAHSCLEATAKASNGLLDAEGALAASYLEQARQYRKPTVSDPFFNASSILERHELNWIDSVEMSVAKMAYEADRDDFSADRLRSVISLSESRYPSNPSVMITASIYKAYKLGEWEDAKRSSDFIKTVHNQKDQSVYVVDTGYALMRSTPAEALDVCLSSYSENSVLMNIFLYSCASRAGSERWLDKADTQLTKLGLRTQEQREKFILEKRLHYSIEDVLIEAIALN